MPDIVAAGLTLISEGCPAPNSAVDPGERVSVSLSLMNNGTASTSNLVATLLPSANVIAPGNSQFYGAIPPGATVSRTFSFTANGNCGDTIMLTLQLEDESAQSTRTFVNRHYLDFLGRQADESGLEFWSNIIERCGSDQQCREEKRVEVSAAFFLSTEFRETGYLVYRMHKAAFGDISPPTIPVPVRRDEFVADLAHIVKGVQFGAGDWQTQLENNKQAFALAFVGEQEGNTRKGARNSKSGRKRFMDAYPVSMTPAEFVRKLDANTGNLLTPDEVSALTNELMNNHTPAGRASVLRKVAESPEFSRAESNRAFVALEYFGYLKRDPDAAPDTDFGSWQYWLSTLDQFDGDFVQAGMVKAFVNSPEYASRFTQQSLGAATFSVLLGTPEGACNTSCALPQLVISNVVLTRQGDTVVASFKVENQGVVTANDVTLTEATLSQPTVNGQPLPQTLGTLAPGQSANTSVTFASPGTGVRVLRLRGTFNGGGSFGRSQRVTLP
ncbi:MAG: DUF4214 domain-containing protein [Rubrivivax sp.]|nr:DUF4214 domain-containing protein [Pyrinomonadaceae bacterium]